MSNLDKDIMMAEKLGYGIHYGRYKADHPHTQHEEETQEAKATCLLCGNSINRPRHNQKYCCTRCQHIAGMRRHLKKRKESEVEHQTLAE